MPLYVDHKIDLSRRWVRSYFTENYNGWSDAFDKGYDLRSAWYCTEHDGEMMACCRVTGGEDNGSLTLEKAGYHFPRDIETVREINNFNYIHKDDGARLNGFF